MGAESCCACCRGGEQRNGFCGHRRLTPCGADTGLGGFWEGEGATDLHKAPVAGGLPLAHAQSVSLVKETHLSVSEGMEGQALASGGVYTPMFDGMGVPDHELGRHGNAGNRMGATNLGKGAQHGYDHADEDGHSHLPSVFSANPAEHGALWESGPQVLDTAAPRDKALSEATEEQLEDFYFQFYRPFYLFHEQVGDFYDFYNFYDAGQDRVMHDAGMPQRITDEQPILQVLGLTARN
jgi:hypothetical protein